MGTITRISLAERVGTYLSLRKTALTLRSEIESIEDCEIDFTGVQGVSGSFADELFGVLIEDRGVEWFKHHVAIIGLEPVIKAALLHAIGPRLQKA